MSEAPYTLAEAQAAPPDVVIGESIYLRRGLIDDAMLHQRYELDLFNESACGRCANRQRRPNIICDTRQGPLSKTQVEEHNVTLETGGGCENYHGRFIFSRDCWLDGTSTEYVACPITDVGWIRSQIRQLPNHRQLVIKRIFQLHRMRYPLRFKGSLFGANARDSNGYPRANQQAIAAEWLKYRVGSIKAPPRTGKTVIATALACELGVKTVIVAHQYKILKQFYDTYMGNPNHPNPRKRRAAMTNAPELEATHGKGSVVLLLDKAKDLEKFGPNPDDWPDILLVTVQKFYHEFDRIAKYINPIYSKKQVDEYHQGAANAYASALFKMKQPYSLGLSATPRRRDGLDKKSVFTVGPVVAYTDTISIPPIIDVYMVKALPQYDYSSWPFACKWARGSEARNTELIDEAFRDLAAGHDVVIIPVGKKETQTYLINVINMRIKALKHQGRGWEHFPYPLAIRLDSDADQDAVIDRVDDGRPCILVAQVSMIKQAIDMEIPSMIYLNEPFSADAGVGSPMFEQMSFRVGTPSPIKPMQPVLKIWIDNISIFRSTLTKLFYNEILPGARNDATPDGPKYLLGKNTHAIMSNLKVEKRKGGSGRGGRRGVKNSVFEEKQNGPVGGSWRRS